jgi:glycerophosphoryl diester phosphodiesterase
VILGPTLALVLAALAASQPPHPPGFEAVRQAWRPSDATLLDRHGEVLHERRVDAARRRLAWTALDEISPALVAAVAGAGGELYAWTVDHPPKIRQLEELGVTGVITNDPRLF